MLTMSPSLWQTWLFTALFISLSWPIHVLCWQWNSHAMPGGKSYTTTLRDTKILMTFLKNLCHAFKNLVWNIRHIHRDWPQLECSPSSWVSVLLYTGVIAAATRSPEGNYIISLRFRFHDYKPDQPPLELWRDSAGMESVACCRVGAQC